jgi:hypothetical protein
MSSMGADSELRGTTAESLEDAEQALHRTAEIASATEYTAAIEIRKLSVELAAEPDASAQDYTECR